MLSRRQIVGSRLDAHIDVGTHERPETSLSETAANQLALEGVQAAQAHRQEVAKNTDLVADFTDALVPSPARSRYDKIHLPIGDLDRVKQLQASLVWEDIYGPHFIVGGRQAKKTDMTSLLLARYPQHNRQDANLRRVDVHTADLEVAEAFMTSLPQQEYSPEDIRLLTDEENGSFRLTERHPKSIKLKTYGLLDDPLMLMLSRMTLAPNLRRGIRSRSYTRAPFSSFKALPVPELTDQTLEDYGVLDHLADLAVTFGKEDELRHLVGDKPTPAKIRPLLLDTIMRRFLECK